MVALYSLMVCLNKMQSNSTKLERFLPPYAKLNEKGALISKEDLLVFTIVSPL